MKRYSASEVARILQTDKEQIKKWSFHFSEYLNPKANPEKGQVREFSIEDLCTMSYIQMYWDENPDMENIRYGLNAEEQFQYPYNDFFTSEYPIFREYSDDIHEKRVWMFGGMGKADTLFLADSYKKGGDTLIDSGIKDEDNIHFFYPAIYNYRHSVELYLKDILVTMDVQLPNDGITHNLRALGNLFKDAILLKFNVVPPKWSEMFIYSLDEFDPKGTAFRYGLEIEVDETFIDLYHIKEIMNRFSNSMHRIKERYNTLQTED